MNYPSGMSTSHQNSPEFIDDSPRCPDCGEPTDQFAPPEFLGTQDWLPLICSRCENGPEEDEQPEADSA